jgi:hypothetical protein
MPDRSTSSMKSGLSVDENESPPSARQLSRSPYPYHRQNGRLQQSSLDPRQGRMLRTPIDTESTFHERKPDYNTQFIYSDSRKRRKISTSPSESGTEADDERPVLLKGLPAPPFRPRKGWKPAGGLGTNSRSSPLLTPSALDDGRESPMAGDMTGSLGPPRLEAEGDTQAKQKKGKNPKRRQAELLRRVLEAMSLAAVGYLEIRSSTVDLLTGKVKMQAKNQDYPAKLYRGTVPHACCGRSLRCVRSSPASTMVPTSKTFFRGIDLQPFSYTCILRSRASFIPCLSAFVCGCFSGIGESGICTSKHGTRHMFATCKNDTPIRIWLWPISLDYLYDPL